MSVQSMTGYGRCEQSFASGKYSAEIKSVNNRFSEIQCRLPRIFSQQEMQIRKYLADKLERGSISINISFESADEEESGIDFDEKAFKQYADLFRRMARSYNGGDLSFSEFSRLFTPFVKEVIVSKPKECQTDESPKEIFEVVEKAAQLLISERIREGEALCKFLLESLDSICENISKVENCAPLRAEKYKNKLNAAAQVLKNDGFDEQRIITEVFLMVEKFDITEEITRLKTHVSAARNLLETESSVGKKLGFWLQEINREINTIGSKANDAAIADIVVSMKDAAEQMREQSLNLL